VHRDVSIKIGVYDPRALNHPSLEVTQAVIGGFDRAPRIFLVESDNHIQEGLKRLQLWREVFTNRVLPFNLTGDPDTREVMIAGEKVDLSRILYEPNVRVSLHAYRARRGPGQINYGSTLKNLLGIIPDTKKDRFHSRLGVTLVDIMEGIGGIDLAVLDASYACYGKFEAGKPFNRVRTDLLVVGRDIVAVDAVGEALMGRNPMDSPSIAEATRRGLGESDLQKVKVLGESLESVEIELPSQ
jgi:uncharacterized protein (DUF362 family)